jgi:hypothetical protein
MLVLQSHDLPEIVEPRDRRFSPMPGEADHLVWGSGDVLDDVGFQEVIRHAAGLGLRVEMIFLQIVAIGASQVAEGPGRLDENLKTPGCRRSLLSAHARKIESIENWSGCFFIAWQN